MSIDRILIVGLGSIGKRHLRLARQLMPHSDIRVLKHNYSTDIAEYSNGSLSNLSEAIFFKPDIAVIASPAPCHIAIGHSLAKGGVHLLIEKPLSDSLLGVAELLKTCKEQGIVIATGYNLRHLESLQYFRSALLTRVIGKVLSVRCEIGQYLPSWRPDSDYRETVSSKRCLGGGVLLELSHELDYLRWIFGEVEWVQASLSKQSNLDIDVEDSAHITIAFQGGDQNYRLIGSVNLDFIRHDTTRMCVAIGEKGSLRWDGLSGAVSWCGENSREWLDIFCQKSQRDDTYLAEWRDFIECIATSKKPLVSGEDGLKVLEIIEAVRNSAESGKRIFLDMTLAGRGGKS